MIKSGPGNLFDITLSHRLSGFGSILLGSKQKHIPAVLRCAADRGPYHAAVLPHSQGARAFGLLKEDVKQMTPMPSPEQGFPL